MKYSWNYVNNAYKVKQVGSEEEDSWFVFIGHTGISISREELGFFSWIFRDTSSPNMRYTIRLFFFSFFLVPRKMFTFHKSIPLASWWCVAEEWRLLLLSLLPDWPCRIMWQLLYTHPQSLSLLGETGTPSPLPSNPLEYGDYTTSKVQTSANVEGATNSCKRLPTSSLGIWFRWNCAQGRILRLIASMIPEISPGKKCQGMDISDLYSRSKGIRDGLENCEAEPARVI